jgi:hypothetical protein
MKVHQISGPPSDLLAQALSEFEEPFAYPLGPGRFFRITHGEDYTLFFRAMGEASCFVAEHQGGVAGTLGTVIRRLRMPDGSERAAAYLGDLKIDANARGGSVLIRLARAAEAWLRPRVQAGFGVVMDGTSSTPDFYTGRAGIPGFFNVGQVVVFRIPCTQEGDVSGSLRTSEEAGLACYHRLSLGRYICLSGEPHKRSKTIPVWMMKPDGSACGMLEDTRKAKRLINGDGSELLSAHLSYFAYKVTTAGVELIQVARQQAASLGFPALFVAVAESDSEELLRSLPELSIVGAPATVYGAGLARGAWNINSSEI